MNTEALGVKRVEDAGRAMCDALDIEGRTDRNPYAMVVGAVGIGFVLGGGLFTRVTARILGGGLRMGLVAALPLLQAKLLEHLTESKPNTNDGE